MFDPVILFDKLEVSTTEWQIKMKDHEKRIYLSFFGYCRDIYAF